MTRFRTTLVAVTAALALLGACSANENEKRTEGSATESKSGGSPAPTRPSSTESASGPAGHGHEALKSAPDLPGDLVKVRSRNPLRTGQVSEGVRALGPNGEVLIGRSRFTETVDLQPYTLILRTAGAEPGEVVITPPVDGPTSQVASADVSKRYVVWKETTSTQLNVVPWQMYAYDRETEEVTLLAESPKLDDGELPPATPGYTGPVLAGERVYWPQVGGTARHTRSDVYACDIADCVPERVAASAAFPVSDGGVVHFVSGPAFNSKRAGERMSVQRVEVDTGSVSTVYQKQLEPKAGIRGLAVRDDRVFMIIGKRASADEAWIIDRSTDKEVVIRSTRSGGFGYPQLGDSFAAWAETSGTSPDQLGGYVYDVETGKVYAVGNTSGLYSVLARGSTLFWQESTTPQARPEDIVGVVATYASR